MAGTRVGGLKAAETNTANNADFYRQIGAMGGKKSKGGGFANDPARARELGRKGGRAAMAKRWGTTPKVSWWEKLKRRSTM